MPELCAAHLRLRRGAQRSTHGQAAIYSIRRIVDMMPGHPEAVRVVSRSRKGIFAEDPGQLHSDPDLLGTRSSSTCADRLGAGACPATARRRDELLRSLLQAVVHGNAPVLCACWSESGGRGRRELRSRVPSLRRV